MYSLVYLLVCLAPPPPSPHSDASSPNQRQAEVRPIAAPPVAAKEPAITVIDESGKTYVVTATDVAQLARRNVKVSDYDKLNAEFEGVSLVALLQSVGVAFGKELKGPRSATVALIEAADGYQIAITLLEIDPATTETFILVADRRDGQPLGEKEGPFRLVIPDDKRQIRWIRMIRNIRIINLKDLSAVVPAKP